MIKKLTIALVLIVCITSGVFATMSYYNPDNSTDTDSNITIGDNTDAQHIENSLKTYINNKDFTDNNLQYTYGYVVNVNGELRHYITDTAYYLESEGFTDRYILCVSCGGVIPVGPVTNPLPEKYICHCNDVGKLGDNYKDFTWSRDEAYAYGQWKESPKSLDESNLMNKTYAIYCRDCNGYVILKDYDKYLNYRLDYWINHYHEVTVFGSRVNMEDIKICSHYNGTLDIFDMYYNHPENLHPGWFINSDFMNTDLYQNFVANYPTIKNDITQILPEYPTSTIGNNSLEEPINDTIDTYSESNETKL